MEGERGDEVGTRFLFEMVVEIDRRLVVGPSARGERRIYYAAGGTFSGPELQGEVLRGSGDWLMKRRDSVSEVDVRATLKTDDGHLIYYYYTGLYHEYTGGVCGPKGPNHGREVSGYYFWVTGRFEAGAKEYEWLNRIIPVGRGVRRRDGVGYRVYGLV